MAMIKKKTWPQYFEHVLSGKKNYDLRLADFEVNEGDTLILEEWDPKTREYTGRTIEKVVTHVGTFRQGDMTDWWTIEEMREKGFHIMALAEPS